MFLELVSAVLSKFALRAARAECVTGKRRFRYLLTLHNVPLWPQQNFLGGGENGCCCVKLSPVIASERFSFLSEAFGRDVNIFIFKGFSSQYLRNLFHLAELFVTTFKVILLLLLPGSEWVCYSLLTCTSTFQDRNPLDKTLCTPTEKLCLLNACMCLHSTCHQVLSTPYCAWFSLKKWSPSKLRPTKLFSLHSVTGNKPSMPDLHPIFPFVLV